MSIVIRRAEAKDVATIVGLLERAGVHSGGVADQVGQFLLVEQEQEQAGQQAEQQEREAVGTVGLEIYEDRYGVMRSLVLKDESWKAQIGLELIRLFLAYAETTGIAELYLLTKSTAPFFIHMGFSTVAFEALPEAVAQSPHFLAHQNGDVLAMVKTYKSTTYPQANVDSVNK